MEWLPKQRRGPVRGEGAWTAANKLLAATEQTANARVSMTTVPERHSPKGESETALGRGFCFASLH